MRVNTKIVNAFKGSPHIDNYLQLPREVFELQACQPCGPSAAQGPHCTTTSEKRQVCPTFIKRDNTEWIFTCNPFSSEAVMCQTCPGFLLKPESSECLGRSYPHFFEMQTLARSLRARLATSLVPKKTTLTEVPDTFVTFAGQKGKPRT